MTLSRRRLRTMQDRWQRDYDTLDEAYGGWHEGQRGEDATGPYVETMRNLVTAIAEINGVINARRKGDPK